MQPEVIALIQQLTNAVQSIALSVDAISGDLRVLNKNMSQLLTKELSKSVGCGLPLGPDCSQTQNTAGSSHIIATSGSQQVSGVAGSSSYRPAEVADPQEKSPRVRECLVEDIRKTVVRSSSVDVAAWQREAMRKHGWVGGELPVFPSTSEAAGRVVGEGAGWEWFRQVQMQASAQGDPRLRLTEGPKATYGGEGSGAAAAGDSGRSLAQLRLFKCPSCDKTFPDKFKLERHLRVHSGEKPFPCAQCGKAFAQKDKLIAHSRIHTGERPFRCEVCGKAYARKEKLTVHRRLHSGERPYRCGACGKAFKDSWNLRKHQRLHIERIYQGVPG